MPSRCSVANKDDLVKLRTKESGSSDPSISSLINRSIVVA